MTHILTATEDHAGLRLDKFLSLALPEISRARFQALIDEGAVTRNAQPLTSASYKVKQGEAFTVTIPEIKQLDLTPSDIKLDIVYEDEDILVLNKPAGMTVHPAAGTHGDTLVHALLAHCGASLSGIGGVARPGIVHRIDKDTSGLLAIAKHDAAHASLSAQLKARDMKRTYTTFAWGVLNPREGTIDAPIARHPRNRKQMAVVEGGRESVTHYTTEMLYRCPGAITPLASKVICDLDTGRTHQIRVHLLHMKCPIIGDPTYGPTTQTRLNRLKSADLTLPQVVADALNLVHRQALHATQLVLTHPKTGEFMEFSCPLPDDLRALEKALLTLTN
ncbi:RluA family pseudouridine synthase [Methylocystis sp.]|uniref:RluA family pseudouridine synthase n=1 Tax=Methylocystis sp. TaxID=1911079 RepID=UPI003DA298DB